MGARPGRSCEGQGCHLAGVLLKHPKEQQLPPQPGSPFSAFQLTPAHTSLRSGCFCDPTRPQIMGCRVDSEHRPHQARSAGSCLSALRGFKSSPLEPSRPLRDSAGTGSAKNTPLLPQGPSEPSFAP